MDASQWVSMIGWFARAVHAAHFGVRRLSDEVLRDSRPGVGVLVVAGELSVAQVPMAVSADLARATVVRSPL